MANMCYSTGRIAMIASNYSGRKVRTFPLYITPEREEVAGNPRRPDTCREEVRAETFLSEKKERANLRLCDTNHTIIA
jgi:hypothetical protein